MLDWLEFGLMYHRSMGILFLWASVQVSMNCVLSKSIALQCSVQWSFLLVLYLYVIALDALDCMLEATRMQGKIRVIYLPKTTKSLVSTLPDDLVLTPDSTFLGGNNVMFGYLCACCWGNCY